MSKKKRVKPRLLVVFDTSVLFAQVAYDLVRSEVRQLIATNSQHSDLTIRWYLPDIVVDERRYQMQNKAFELLPSIEKLERLLGHNLNITKAILVGRVNEAIAAQLEELKILTLGLDVADVEWKSLVNRAVYRLPPFEPGKNEKGFRDSIIAETFLQLTRKSPATPAICRLAIVTSDKLLAEYVRANTKGARNVRVLNSTGELESLINTLVSKVTEEFVANLKEKATRLFFEYGNQYSLFYKENIRGKINDSFAQELEAVPTEGLLRENGTWRISSPVFIKKEQRRLFYTTSISVDAKLVKLELLTPGPFNVFSPASDALQLYTTPTFDLYPNASLSGLGESITSLNQNDRLQDSGQLPNATQSSFLSSSSSSSSSSSLSSSGLPSFSTSSLPSSRSGQSSSMSSLRGTSQDSVRKVEMASGQSIFEVHWSTNVTQNKKLTVPRIEKIEFVTTEWDG